MKRNEKVSEETRAKVLSLIDSEFDSDADFERKMELAPKTVNNWRRGKSASFMKMLPTLAESFEISVGELLAMPIQRNGSELSDDEVKLLELYRKSGILTVKQRMCLMRSLEEIINLYMDSNAESSKSKRNKA
jgi:transcriptional regulator with XRE-family HTH domain